MNRNQAWLENLLEDTWSTHFSDVPQRLPVEVKWGKRARTRLGSITLAGNKGGVVIRLTKLFADPAIPAYVVKATLVHELCHYAHGFHSGLEQRYRHPHAGGVIRQEFAQRGLEDLYLRQKQWLKQHWLEVIKREFPQLARRYRQVRVKLV